MKFSTILTGLLSLTSFVLSADAVADDEKPKIVKFNADYIVKEHPEATAQDVVELFNGETVTLTYTVSNYDDVQISIIGVGGTFLDPQTNEVRSNITAGSVGPIVLEPGQSQQFSQAINLNLVSDSYVLAPLIYIYYGEEYMTVKPRLQLTTVSDVPISIFNPQLLFLEIVLLASLGGVAYFIYEAFGKSYIQGTAPVKKTFKANSDVGATISLGKTFDSSWIPEGHIKKTKKA